MESIPLFSLFQKVIGSSWLVKERYTGPTIKRNDSKVVIMTYNFFPVEVEEGYLYLVSLIDKTIPLTNSEVIRHIGQGEIYDQGIKSFQIDKSTLWEAYFYEPEDFLYARVLLERDLSRNKSWLSFDVDYIIKTPWF